MKFSKIVVYLSISWLLILSMQLIIMYRDYASFPSYSRVGGSWFFDLSMSKMLCYVNWTIEGPTKLIAGIKMEYNARFYFWNFSSDATKIALEKIVVEIDFYVLSWLQDECIIPLNNYIVVEGSWLNLTIKLTFTPVEPHAMALLSSENFRELKNQTIYILTSIKHAVLNVWFEYYVFMKNGRIHRVSFESLDVISEGDNSLEIVILDWSPIIFYELPLLIVYLLYLYLKGGLSMSMNETASKENRKVPSEN